MEPTIFTAKELRPERIQFVPSTGRGGGTGDNVKVIAERIAEQLPGFGSGRWDDSPGIPDPENLQECMRTIRRLTPMVNKWTQRGEEFEVYVDITTGTKAMIAAMALVAQTWPCQFVYVGGSRRDERGNVISGSERLIVLDNPQVALGYQLQEDAVTMFNDGNYAAVIRLLQDNTRHIKAEFGVRQELGTFEALATGYHEWDRFQHDRATRAFRRVRGNLNDLRQMFGQDGGERLHDEVGEHMEWLAQLNPKSPGRWEIYDLLANARRRSLEGRFDDAVVRLYRAIEAIAQIELMSNHGIVTAEVRAEQVPLPLRNQWWGDGQAGESEPRPIGLQEAYALLDALGDELGAKFRERMQPKSPDHYALSRRNTSMLGHGFEPISEGDFKQLWGLALELSNVDESELPRFPRLQLHY